MRELPVDKLGLDELVADVIAQYGAPSGDATYETICDLIMRMPPQTTQVDLKFFADTIHKSRTNAVAYAKLEEFAKVRAEARKQAETLAKEAANVKPNTENT